MYNKRHDGKKALSYDALADKISRQIRLVGSYLEMPELNFILPACRLRPIQYAFTKPFHRNEKTLLYKEWCDEFGNTLNVVRKSVKIIHNDISLDKSKITTSDFYYGLTIDKIASMSKFMHLVFGKDEDLFQDYYLITFLGIDNYLRTYLCLYGNWQQVSPLMIGVENLKLCSEYLKNRELMESVKEETLTMPCVGGQLWLSLLPASKVFLEKLKVEAEPIYHIIGKGI